VDVYFSIIFLLFWLAIIITNNFLINNSNFFRFFSGFYLLKKNNSFAKLIIWMWLLSWNSLSKFYYYFFVHYIAYFSLCCHSFRYAAISDAFFFAFANFIFFETAFFEVNLSYYFIVFLILTSFLLLFCF